MNTTVSGTTLSFSRPTLPIGSFSKPKMANSSSNRAMNMNILVALAHSGMPTVLSPHTHRITIRHTIDPKILAMSDKEYISAIEALGGIWADRKDITDNWLDEIRGEWDKRVDDLYAASSETINPSV